MNPDLRFRLSLLLNVYLAITKIFLISCDSTELLLLLRSLKINLI